MKILKVKEREKTTIKTKKTKKNNPPQKKKTKKKTAKQPSYKKCASGPTWRENGIFG